VKLLDFGLARSADGGDQVTRSGAVLGTPAFMAPEQARGKPVDARADLFSLGVVLYHMATGKLPFDGPDTLAILSSLALDTPPAPRDVNPQVPTELSEFIMKLLAKDPRQRPATAREVAEKLSLMGDDSRVEPAKPRAARPRRGLLIGLGLIGVAAAIIAGVIIIVRDKDGKVVAKFEAPDGHKVEVVGTDDTKGPKQKIVEPTPPVASVPPANPVGKPPPAESPNIKPAPPIDANAPLGQPLSAQAFVQRPVGLPGVAGWTVETRGHRGAVLAMAYRPGTKLLASAGSDGVIRLWDDGKLVRALLGHAGDITVLAWSHDGKTLASGGADKLVRLWDGETGQLRHTLEGHTQPVQRLAWSPDDKRLASAGQDLVIRLWNAASWQLIHPIRGQKELYSGLGWLADGKRLISGDSEHVLRYWDADDGLPKGQKPLDLKTGLRRFEVSPDGKTLAAADIEQLRLFVLNGSVPNASGILQTIEKTSAIGSFAWAPDSQRFAWAATPWTVAIGHVKGSAAIRLLLTKSDCELTAVAFSADGKEVSGAGNDGSIFTWDANTEALVRTVPGAGVATITQVAWSGDGRHFATSEHNGTVRIWKAATSELEHMISEAFWGWIALSADGKLLATGNLSAPQIHVWDVEAGKRVQAFDGEAILSWSPHGKKLAYRGKGGGFFMWDAGSDKPPASAAGEPVPFGAIAWSRDGGRIAAFGQDKIWVWETATGKAVRTINAGSQAGALSPDGKRLAMGRYGLRIWDLESGRSEPEQVAVNSEFRQMVWRPDGKSVVALNNAEMVTWDLERTGEPLHRATGDFWVRELSPDGRLALIPNYFALAMYDVVSGHSGATLLPRSGGRSIAISPEGHWRAGGAEAELVHVVKPTAGPMQVLTPAEFSRRFGWTNDGAKVKLTPTP
jgi:WD40 repeat protein